MRKSLMILALAATTAGCGIVYRQPIYQGNLIEPTSAEQLQPGMSKQQVASMLGTPSIEDPFHHDRWDSVSSQRIGRTGAPVVKTMTLWFENGQLARWEGEYFPEQDSELAKNAIHYFGPNLAKDKKKRR